MCCGVAVGCAALLPWGGIPLVLLVAKSRRGQLGVVNEAEILSRGTVDHSSNIPK